MLHRNMLVAPVDDATVPDWPRRFQQLAAAARDARLKRYYAAGAPAADAPLSTVPMAALDIEIVSLALVPMALVQIRFLDAALRARVGEGLTFPVIDTMALEARLHRRPAWFWGRWRRQPPAPSIRLADSRRRHGLPDYRPHHAPTDALATAELLLAQVAAGFSPQTQLGELWD